ncbi:uncharacterized protein SRS1_16198 [Sporisorium reilianum f. sp. reilianum]|uniref:Uncharacterized protein n=1 Tax=Sporisorium reilianum f. sp. reilianum TaxID=72559 RepID=A0A2N8UL65_9BASI|nr:uncharacterized protein SRS1_16198 [Sporisorium reilianum f. sp. reilianum]
MSRKVVSYSDISEDAPLPPATSPAATQGEAGPSTNGGGAAKRKRKAGAQMGSGKVGRKGMVHWDDPSYGAAAREEEGVDGQDDEDGGGNDGVDEAYTDWKYDEWGEPYGSTHGHFDPEGAHDDYEVDDTTAHDAHYDNDDQDDDDAPLPFAIPDIAEFHRTLQPPLPSPHSTTPMPTHRPPHAVGGGGRTLTHTELFGPTSITTTFNAALTQYHRMHALAPPLLTTEPAHAALWHDAPAHDSLLAQQVKMDAEQVVSLRSAARAIGHATGTSGTSGMVGIGKQGKKGGRTAVTVVPHAHVEGNAAWRKALKTVASTPNRIGIAAPSTTATVTATQSGALDLTTVSAEQDRLHAYWYAGYRAGVAATAKADTEAGKADASTTAVQPPTPRASAHAADGIDVDAQTDAAADTGTATSSANATEAASDAASATQTL